jgi:aspartate/methionine/tyrosine aminotransferase
LLCSACFDVGDYVAIASSGYPCYRNILSALGCKLATVTINKEFKLTAKELKEEISRRKDSGEIPLKGLILSSPSNPTGAMLHPEELQALCQLCEKENILFISDEIYHGISYGAEEATALQYSSKAIIINSFSKYYSMSGWRLGWMVIPESLMDAINSLQQNMFINAPTISQTAAMKCWDENTIKELEGHVQKYRTSRELILEQLKKFKELDPKNIAPADGGFYIYIDLGDENIAPGFGSVKMCEELLETYHVAFTPGNDFEDPESSLGDRRFRISYAGGINAVREAMDRFYQFWPTWIEKVKAAK